MKPTHYAVRDLNLVAPDEFPAPAWDILRQEEDGRVYCSEDIHDNLADALAWAETFRRAQVTALDLWQMTPLKEEILNRSSLEWLPVHQATT